MNHEQKSRQTEFPILIKKRPDILWINSIHNDDNDVRDNHYKLIVYICVVHQQNSYCVLQHQQKK